MLNSVPESMRACLIEAAKLAGPAFKHKVSDPAAAGAASSSGPLSFNISVDAGRGPPAPAADAVAAFATAAANGAGGSGGMPNAGEACGRTFGSRNSLPYISLWCYAGFCMFHASLASSCRRLCFPPAAESDPLISGLMVGALGSDPLLGPLPPLSAPPSSIPALPLPGAVQAAGRAAGSSAAGPAAGGGAQQLLSMGMLG